MRLKGGAVLVLVLFVIRLRNRAKLLSRDRYALRIRIRRCTLYEWSQSAQDCRGCDG